MNRDEIAHLLRSVMPAWVSDRLVGLVALLAMFTDTGFGLILATAPRTEFRSPIFDQARMVMHLQAWGVLLLVLVFAAGLSWWVLGRSRFTSFWLIYVLGLGYWSFWTVLSTASAIGINGVSGIFPLFCGVIGTMHVLAGLAWTHPPRIPARR